MESISTKLRRLRCSGGAEGFESLNRPPNVLSKETEEALHFILDYELSKREDTRISKAIRDANVPYFNASQETLMLTGPRKIKSQALNAIFRPFWIDDSHNILLQGAEKSGKTWVSSALAVMAIRNKKKTHFVTFDKFIEDIAVASIEGKMHELYRVYDKFSVMVIDDWLEKSITDLIGNFVIDFLSNWASEKSVILTSTMSPNEWQAKLPTSDGAAKIIQTFCNNSYPIELMPPAYEDAEFINMEGR